MTAEEGRTMQRTDGVTIKVGGEPRTLDAGARVAALVEGDGRGVAIARNGTVVLRDEWERTELQEGDEIEIVRAVQGG